MNLNVAKIQLQKGEGRRGRASMTSIDFRFGGKGEGGIKYWFKYVLQMWKYGEILAHVH